jgi:PAS domain S-box-containing protein
MIVFDRSGQCLDINPRCCRWLGGRRSSVIGKEFARVFRHCRTSSGDPIPSPSDWTPECGALVFSGKRALQPAQLRMDRLTGGNLLVTISDESAMTGATRTHPMAEYALEYSGDAIYWVTRHGRILDVNAAACAQLEYSRDELRAMTIFDIDPNFPRERWPSLHEEVRQKKVVRVESFHRSQSGRVFPVEVVVNLVLYKGEEYQCSFVRDITVRKEAEKEAQLDAERLQMAFEVSRQSFFDFRLDTDEAIISDEFVRMLGYEPGTFKMTSTWWRNLVHPEDTQGLTVALESATRVSNSLFRNAFRMKTASGAWRWILSTGRVVEATPEGIPLRMLGTHMDINEQKEAELKLSRSLEMLRATLAAAPVAIISIDTEGCVSDLWNAAAEQLFGWKREEVLGKFIPTIPQGATAEKELFQLAASSGTQLIAQEVNRVRKDGTPVNCTIFSTPQYDEAGDVIGHVAVLVDITERRRAAEKLGRAKALLEAVIEQSPIAKLVILAQVSIVRNGNRALKSLLGIPSDTRLNGMTVEQMKELTPSKILSIDGSPTPPGEQSLEILFSSDPVRGREICIERADGSIRYAELDIVPVFDRNSRIIASLVLCPDITARKKAELASRASEERIRALNDTLEIRVQERTVQLEAANRELEAFAYSVSHDLRAPLRAIEGYTKVLLEDFSHGLDREGLAVCGVIQGETQRLSALIRDLLEFSRLSRMELRYSSIDMTALVRAVYEQVITLDERERIDLRIDDLPTIVGDEQLLRQVWFNLLSNAVKFTSKKDRPEIRVTARVYEREAVFVIKDNGSGFDMAYADKLFGVFQRLHSTSEFDGTGVGLAIVQRIVHRHGGRVNGEGIPDVGATFTFTLPLRIPGENAAFDSTAA